MRSEKKTPISNHTLPSKLCLFKQKLGPMLITVDSGDVTQSVTAPNRNCNIASLRFSTFRHNKLGAGQTRRRSELAQKKNELTLLYSAWIKNKNRTQSLVFNGNSLRLEHDCIFALPLRLSVNHSHTFKVTILRSTSIKKNQHQLKIKILLSDLVDCLLRYQCSIAIKYCISVIATHRSPAAFTRSLVFVSCKNGCVTINKAATCNTSLQVLCNAAYVKTKHCQLSSSCVKLLYIKIHKK